MKRSRVSNPVSHVLYLFFAFILSGCGNEPQAPVEVSTADSLATSYLNTAIKTADWLQSKAITTPHGITWRANPEDSSTVYHSLYYGSPGILLYFLELYHVTKDTSYLRIAERASDDLLAVVSDRKSDFFTKNTTGFTGPENTRSGLYSGLSGIGFSLGEMYSASGNEKYKNGMLECVKALKDSVKIKGDEASWSTTQDLLCGDAGVGLFLLDAYKRTDDTSLLRLAEQTGNALVRKGIVDGQGLKWPMEPSFPRLMPNFAHGTSGVCYFLVSLVRYTGPDKFLEAGLKGANHLLASSDSTTGFVFHHEGDGKFKGKCGGPACVNSDTCVGSKLFYLSWCHGPAGTGRLYSLLSRQSTAPEFQTWYDRRQFAAQNLLKTGIPEQLSNGYWNNLGQCCGAAGVGEYFLDIYNPGHTNEFLKFARHCAAFIQKNAVEEAGGLKFPHAENNRERDVVYAQTGYMTGAAGIGMFFLHLYELEKGIKREVNFPDSPFKH